jgi:hypothetical protein
MLNGNKDFLSIGNKGINVLSLGAIPKRPI